MSGQSETGTGVLRTLASRALAAETSEQVDEALLEALSKCVATDQVHLSRVSQDAAVGRARVIEPAGAGGDEYTQVFDERPSGVAHVVATGEPLHVPDARTSREIRTDYAERFQVGSMLFLPLGWSGDVHQVAILIRHEQKPFTPDELALGEALAQTAALGLARQESERDRAAQRVRDGALARAAQALRDEPDLQAVLEALAREADLALAGDLAGFYLGDGEQGGVATAGHNVPEAWHGLVLPPGQGVAGQVLASGRPVITNAYQQDVQLPELPPLGSLQTAVGVPVRSGDGVIGALSVGFERMRRIGELDLMTLEAIAALAAVACEGGGASGSAGRVSARR